jgi:type IV pilus assembly protein PilW
MRRKPDPIRSLGFTLVEIMIALLIGVIGIVVMMQTFAVSEGFKRTATSGTDAQINGSIALYLLQRELRLAGFGMNNLMIQGCPSVRVWNNASGTGMDLHLVPIEINPASIPAGDANTDTLLVAYGNSASFVAGIPVSTVQGGGVGVPTAPFPLASNWDSFQTGDLFVSFMPTGGPGGTPSCVMHEATATTNPATNCGFTPATAATVEHKTTAYQQQMPTGCVNTVPKFNSATGITDSTGAVVPALNYPNGLVFDLGNLTLHVYAIRNGSLTMCDWVASDCTSVANYTTAVDDIVSLRAVYGMNLTPTVNQLQGDGTVTWNRNSLTTNVFLPSRVLAVSLEVTARSGLKEKYNAAGVCTTTPNANKPDLSQTWLWDSMAGANIDLHLSAPPTSMAPTDWQCYRYKLFQTNVPIRNNIWRP